MKSFPKVYFLSLTLSILLVGQIIFAAANVTFTSFFYTEAQVSGGTWTKIADLADPQTRRSTGWAYDSIHNVIVMFGGVGSSPGSTGQTWIYNLTSQSWAQKFPPMSPPTRSVHSMTFDIDNGLVVLFGGYQTSHSNELNDLWVYDVVANTWTQPEIINSPTTPIDRHWPGLAYDPAAKLTVLFGGHDKYGAEGVPGEQRSDTWLLHITKVSGAWKAQWTHVFPSQHPSGRQTSLIYNPNDGLMYMFGGKYEVDVGGPQYDVQFYNDLWSYNVAANTWTIIHGNSTSPSFPEPRRAKLAYDPVNNLLMIFGGEGPYDTSIPGFTPYGDTWIFDFDTTSWSEISTNPSPQARFRHMTVYDPYNQKLLVYGGTPTLPQTLGDMWQFQLNQPAQTITVNAGADQSSQVGSPASFSGSYSYPGSLVNPIAEWKFGDGEKVTGSVPAALLQSHTYATAQSYAVSLTITDDNGNYGTDSLILSVLPSPQAEPTWVATDTTAAPSNREEHTAVWTGSKMIVWGGFADGSFLNTGATYDPSTDNWSATSTTGAPGPRKFHAAVWTGTTMIIWGGNLRDTGGIYNPDTNTWTATSTTNAPSARSFPTGVWTGSKMIVWGGSTGAGVWTNTGGIYDPLTNTWTATSTTNAPSPRQDHTAVWTGSKMIVWGGSTGTTYLNTGGIYDPATDSWSPVSTTNAPLARTFHSAIWTGSEMIVWGGLTGPGARTNTGGIYDPLTNTWSPLSTGGAPTARDSHTAVWTGSEMIVWSGFDTARTNTGGIYDPLTNTWSPTPITNVPQGRTSHTAVWTGSEMIVWGGLFTSPPNPIETNTGGRLINLSGTPDNTPPVATSSEVTTEKNTAATFQLVASDADNDPLSYSITAQPDYGIVSNFNSNTGTGTYTPNTNFVGIDSIFFKVNDGLADSNIGVLTINVTLPSQTNSPPTANAGPNQIANENTVVTLDGSGSTDSDGTITSYSWTQTGGTNTVTLSGANTANPSFTAPSVGPAGDILTFELVVSDNDGAASSPDSVTITVNDQPAHATTLLLNSITSVGWSRPVTIMGTLTDNDASGVGIGGKTITFSGTGATGLPSSPVLTNPDGTFSVTGVAPGTVASGWTVQAHFAGDADYLADDSNTRMYSTLKHRVFLSVSVKDLPWGQPTSFVATLKDSTAGGLPIAGKTISYDGTGVIGVTNQVTNIEGFATGAGVAPGTVASGWTVQAHFAGDSQYFDAHTAIKSYSTTKHGTYLSLNVIPISPPAGGIYRVEGLLRDTVTGSLLESQTISFTADSPIVISDAVTAADGKYLKSGLVAPSTPGNYGIQAHYSGSESYLARSSILRTLTVS